MFVQSAVWYQYENLMGAEKGAWQGTYGGLCFFYLFFSTLLLSLLLVVYSPLTALFLHDSSHGFDDGMSFYKAKRGVGVRSFRNTALKCHLLSFRSWLPGTRDVNACLFLSIRLPRQGLQSTCTC